MIAPRVTFELAATLPRKCGDCQLCCKLLPVKEIGKLALTRCRHQAHGKGCRLYGQPAMPSSCRLWSCAWVTGANTGARPDRVHAVVDILPDFVTIEGPDVGPRQTMPVVQVWVDPDFPDAHRDPGLRAYLATRGVDGVAALIRTSERDAFVLLPPAMTSDGEWHEWHSNCAPVAQHRFAEIVKAWAGGD